VKVAPHRVRPWFVLALLVSVLACIQVGVAHERLQVVAEQSLLQRDVRQVEDEISRMNIELATLMRPDRLRKVAVEKLGMRPPSAMQVVHW